MIVESVIACNWIRVCVSSKRQRIHASILFCMQRFVIKSYLKPTQKDTVFCSNLYNLIRKSSFERWTSDALPYFFSVILLSDLYAVQRGVQGKRCTRKGVNKNKHQDISVVYVISVILWRFYLNDRRKIHVFFGSIRRHRWEYSRLLSRTCQRQRVNKLKCTTDSRNIEWRQRDYLSGKNTVIDQYGGIVVDMTTTSVLHLTFKVSYTDCMRKCYLIHVVSFDLSTREQKLKIL